MARMDKHEYYLDIADTVSMRGTCLRRNYGAVIVNNDVIVGTGYVGAPRGRANCCDIGYCYRQAHNIPRGTQYETCLAKDTKIPVSDGIKTIEQIYQEGVEPISVLSIDYRKRMISSTNLIKDGVGINIRKTKYCETLLRVPIISLFKEDNSVLEDGYIDCTPDHKFLTPTGWVEAGNLVRGSILGAGIQYMQAMVRETPEEIEYNDYVYDIEVPDYENFAAMFSESCYVFVHNCRSVHAEQNAIINAGRDRCIGATLYLSGREMDTGNFIKNADCCSMCKRLIINAGIETVVIKQYDDPGEYNYDIIPVNNWIKDDDSLSDTVGY